MRFPFLASIALFASVSSAQTAAPTAPTAQIWDFSTSKPDPKLAGFAEAYTAPGGVATSVSVAPIKGALRFTNRAGGSFGVKINVPAFDANQFPTLDFSYTRSSDTKVNFFFRVNGAYYGVIFSGPARVRPGTFLLGTIPNVGAQGRVSLPLRDWLRRFQPRADKLQVEEILVGNWDNEGYLVAGIGGNGPGATWSLTRLALLPATGAPPQLETPRFEGNRIVWPLQSGNLDTRTAVLSVAGRDYGFDSPHVLLETTLAPTPAQRVVFEAGNAGLAFSDGQRVELKLAGATQTLLYKRPESGSGAAPATEPLPRLEWDGAAPLSLDFETDAGGVEARSAVLQLDARGAASGQNSLRFFNPRTASPFDASFKIAAFDAAQFPILTFAYRNDSRLRVDFRLRWEGKEYFVRFTDRDGTRAKLGEIENIPDGKWHHGVIPLLDWMKRARPDATNFTLETLGVSDDGWMGNPNGISWDLDDLRAAPAISGSLKARATLRDISGVNSVSYSIDQSPTAEVNTSPEGGPLLDLPLAGRAPGLYFLHLRAQNGAGIWSEAAHFPFVVK